MLNWLLQTKLSIKADHLFCGKLSAKQSRRIPPRRTSYGHDFKAMRFFFQEIKEFLLRTDFSINSFNISLFIDVSDEDMLVGTVNPAPVPLKEILL